MLHAALNAAVTAGLLFTLCDSAATTYVVGDSWSCPAEGPLQLWVNEINIGATTQTLELMGLTAVIIDGDAIDVALLAADGSTLARRSLAAGCPPTAVNVAASPGGPAVNIYMCQNWGLTQDTVRGIALINTANATGDTLLQLVSYATIPVVFMGVTGCVIPARQAEHAESPTGNSLQLIGIADYDAVNADVNVFNYTWQGFLPSTWGQINAGDSQWGTFQEVFVTANLGLAPAPVPTGNGTGTSAVNCVLGE